MQYPSAAVLPTHNSTTRLLHAVSNICLFFPEIRKEILYIGLILFDTRTSSKRVIPTPGPNTLIRDGLI